MLESSGQYPETNGKGPRRADKYGTSGFYNARKKNFVKRHFRVDFVIQ